MNAEREQGLRRLHLALEVIAGLKPLLTQAESDLLGVSMKYDDVDWVGYVPPTPLWNEIKRECVEIVYAFHLEAIDTTSDELDPSAVAYGILKEIEASQERAFPRSRAALFNPDFLKKMAGEGLLTPIGKGFIHGPKSRQFIADYEAMHAGEGHSAT